MDNIVLEVLPEEFSVCQTEDFSEIDWNEPFLFAAGTDTERSFVCPARCVPEHAVKEEPGWIGMRIEGKLDFSLIGILARISGILAKVRVGIFVVSTFDTDYIFVKKEQFPRARRILKQNGYTFIQKKA